MKKNIFLFLFVSCMFLLNNNKVYTQQNEIDKTFVFENDNFDFGKIPYGEEATYTIKIKNISNQDAVLDSVKAECGCTKLEYTTGFIIKPNQYATVVLGFNGYAEGHFSKIATIFLNGKYIKSVSFRDDAIK